MRVERCTRRAPGHRAVPTAFPRGRDVAVRAASFVLSGIPRNIRGITAGELGDARAASALKELAERDPGQVEGLGTVREEAREALSMLRSG